MPPSTSSPRLLTVEADYFVAHVGGFEDGIQQRFVLPPCAERANIRNIAKPQGCARL
jgi:hypothetical protein